MAIHDIWIIAKNSGMSLYHMGYGSVEIDQNLLSGFLSAINTLAETEFDQKGVDSINMGEYKFLYDHYCGLIFSIASDPTEPESAMKKLLVEIRECFFQQFEEMSWLNFIEETVKAGDMNEFKSFDDTLGRIIAEYKGEKVENKKNKELLLDLYNSSINTFIKKVMTFSKLLREDFEAHISKDIKKLVRNNEEMNKIEIFERGIAFDSINLDNIEFDELKKFLHEIFDGVINTGYELLGDKPINKLIPEMYPIFARKLSDIEKLGISMPILRSLINFFYFHGY